MLILPSLLPDEIVLGGASVPNFVTQIHASVKHLRHVEVGYHGTNATLRSAMRALQPARELEVLSITILCFGEGRNAWSMAQSLSAWVKAQCSRRRSSGSAEKKDVRDVVKVLKFETDAFANGGFLGWPMAPKEYEEEVKEKLVVLMK